MKYAYIFGSNAFIIPENSISYTDNDQTIEFLRINSIYHDTANPSEQSALTINANIRDTEGRALKLVDNKAEAAIGFTITEERNRVLVLDADDKTVLDVHQIDDESAMELEHNIIAELEVNAPVVVIRVRGNFMLGRMHTEIDNEKLFIINNSIANSVLNGHGSLVLTAAGVAV